MESMALKKWLNLSKEYGKFEALAQNPSYHFREGPRTLGRANLKIHQRDFYSHFIPEKCIQCHYLDFMQLIFNNKWHNRKTLDNNSLHILRIRTKIFQIQSLHTRQNT